MQELVQSLATRFNKDLFSKPVEFQTAMDGRRQILRYVPELDGVGVQELPPENLRRSPSRWLQVGQDLGHRDGDRLVPFP